MSNVGNVVSNNVLLEAPTLNTTTIDGTPATGTIGAASSGTVTLSNSQINDVIVLAIATTGAVTATNNPVSDGQSMTWKMIGQGDNGSGLHLEYWIAKNTVALSSDVITVNLATSGNAAMLAFSIAGSFISAPLDGIAKTSASGSSAAPASTVTTSNPTDMIVGIFGYLSNPSFTVGAGYTIVTNVSQSTNVSVAAQYKNVTTVQTAVTDNATLGSSQLWVAIGDAFTSNARNITLIQPSSSNEWVVHNLYFGNNCTVAKSDGYVHIPLYTLTGNGAISGLFFHATNSNFLVVTNTSSVNDTFGYDGIRTF